MARFEYRTAVLDYGPLGQWKEQLNREELSGLLAHMGADGWERSNCGSTRPLFGERDGHLLVFKRAVP